MSNFPKYRLCNIETNERLYCNNHKKEEFTGAVDIDGDPIYEGDGLQLVHNNVDIIWAANPTEFHDYYNSLDYKIVSRFKHGSDVFKS